MTEEQTMPNLDIKDFQSRSAVEKLDYILMVLSNGTGAKITVDLLLKVLLKDIQPSVNEKGELLFGGITTGVLVTGKSPFLQASENGIEWKYEGETSLRPLVSYEQLKLKFGDLTPEQINDLKLKLSDLTAEEIESLRGVQGIQGLIGKSAYQSAFENGYKGTEAQFGAEQSSIAGNGGRLTAVESGKADKPIAGRTFLTPLFVARGAVFNDKTGYYELNGLTDITESQMIAIYNHTNCGLKSTLLNDAFTRLPIRTNYPIAGLYVGAYTGLGVEARGVFSGNNEIEIINLDPLINLSTSQFMFYNCFKLKTITGELNVSKCASITDMFGSCNLLESVKINKLNLSISFSSSPNLKREDILYLVMNSINTTPIIVHLHPIAKTRLTEEDIALASSKNITIA